MRTAQLTLGRSSLCDVRLVIGRISASCQFPVLPRGVFGAPQAARWRRASAGNP
jgi:hypothetical protein